LIKKINAFSIYGVFFISFVSAIIVFVPDIIRNHGIYLGFGDYSFQQIPFYVHAADTVYNHGIGWDWYTDLGSDFLTSYSFYLLGSCFFWIISWLPGRIIIYAMPFMIALKTALAALGAYAYIKRYVKTDQAAFLGAVMYAFSGFQLASLVFNHFHDITALFPFLLLSFELLVTENRRVYFAVVTGLTALTNYYFFYGIVIFILIYYIVRIITKEYRFSLRNFASIFLEAVIGTGLAAVILFPSAELLFSADRFSDTLYGTNLISYSDNTIIPKIFQSLFLIPDPPSKGMLFLSEDNANNWASISLYLPFFAVTGVAAYIKNNRKSWITILLGICAVMAVIPGLNSIFSMMNETYYARWYFMPVLIMSLATSAAIDRSYDLKTGINIQAAGLIILAFIFCLPDKVTKESDELNVLMGDSQHIEEELKMFSISDMPVVFWQAMAFSVLSLAFVYVYNIQKDRDDKILNRIAAGMTAFIIVIFSVYIDSSRSSTYFDSSLYTDSSLDFVPEIEQGDNFRITHANLYINHNASLFWNYMNAGCFHSIESNESDIFYYEVQGEKRLVRSQYTEEDYPVYGLLSVKYIFNPSTGDDLNVERFPVHLNGCSLYDKQGPYYIYKNDNFVPMGFMYDYCIDSDTLESYLDDNVSDEDRYQYKKLIMMRALVLDEMDKEKYSGYISEIPAEMLDNLDENTYAEDCSARALQSCSDFEYDSGGYRADISSASRGLVYFSVPCSAGWKATVNGESTELIKVHYGLTAVPVDDGLSHIEFVYETPGLKQGKLISCISLSVLLIYACLAFVSARKKRNTTDDKS